MGLETGVTYIEDLVETNPIGATDTLDESDNHHRIIKTAVKGSFPNLGAAAVTSTAAELNILDGVTATTAEINQLDGATLAHRGCLLHRGTQSITASSYTAIVFDTANSTEEYDTDTYHDLVINPSRITIPAGITKVRLSCGNTWSALAGAGQFRAKIYKNGVATYYESANLNYPGVFSLTMPIIEVIATDYFEFYVYQDDTTQASLNNWLAMEVIE